MASVTGAAARAAGSAAVPAADVVDSVNQPTGAGVASPAWPGAVDPTEYTNPGDLTKSQALNGQLPGQQFSEVLPHLAPGGGYQDTSWDTGHDAPQAPWDSLAGPPFAGSGAIAAADTHAQDTGAVYVAEHVTPPDVGHLVRRTLTGEAMNLEWGFDPATGERLNAPAGRSNLDQYQVNDAAGFDPWMISYAERPIYNNLAHEATPYAGPGIYSPSGALAPPTEGNAYAAVTYQAPPDPTAGTAAPAAAGTIGGGWVLG